MAKLTVRRLGYALGAEVQGFDGRQELDEPTVDAIRKAWLEDVVLCFPGQALNEAEFAAFCSRFGELDDNRRMPSMRDSDNAAVLVMANKTLTVKGNVHEGKIDNHWHSDLSHTTRPSTATFLNAKALPEVGGDTMFANMYRAYDALSPKLQSLLEPLEAIHDTTVTTAYKQLSAQVQAEMARLNPPVVHPVVRTHPETGRKGLYIGKVRSFVGMTQDESQPLIDFLTRHATRYEFVYRHRWSLGDLVMWDNRCALHYAVPDYDLRQLRQMQRCTVLGPPFGRLAGVAD